MEFEVCADIIATYNGKLVLIERLSYPKGYALPGGRKDGGESLEQCAVREFKEETGLDLTLQYQLHTYSTPGRDPRGEKISTAFVGTATGTLRNEPGKTRVFLMDIAEVERHKEKFVFDHYQMLQDYGAYKNSNRFPKACL